MSKPKTTRRTPAPRVDRSPPAPSSTEANAALDALADALAPRLFERLKRLAADERQRDADDADTIAYLESLGWRAERRP